MADYYVYHRGGHTVPLSSRQNLVVAGRRDGRKQFERLARQNYGHRTAILAMVIAWLTKIRPDL